MEPINRRAVVLGVLGAAAASGRATAQSSAKWDMYVMTGVTHLAVAGPVRDADAPPSSSSASHPFRGIRDQSPLATAFAAAFGSPNGVLKRVGARNEPTLAETEEETRAIAIETLGDRAVLAGTDLTRPARGEGAGRRAAISRGGAIRSIRSRAAS